MLTRCSILVVICICGFQNLLTGAVKNSRSFEFEKSKKGLAETEIKKPQAFEVIKQVQKLNTDGSYTVGYEDEDGTFKIESRDILGNAKETFRYIDEKSEIKRVPYTTRDSAGVKGSSHSDSTEDHAKIKSSVISTTRRPAINITRLTTPTRSAVIQTIPRHPRLLSFSSTNKPNIQDYSTASTSYTTKSPKDPTTTIIYATSVPTPKKYVTLRPTSHPVSNGKPADQISRPEKLEINHVSKVQISSKPLDPSDKDDDQKSIRGNTLRRQLMLDDKNGYTTTAYFYGRSNNDDSTNAYNSYEETRVPLFPATEANSRIPTLLLSAKQRASQIQAEYNTNAREIDEKLDSRNTRPVIEINNDKPSETTSNYYTQKPISIPLIKSKYAQKFSLPSKEYVNIAEGRAQKAPEILRKLPSNTVSNLMPVPIVNAKYLREAQSQNSQQIPEQYYRTRQIKEEGPVRLQVQEPYQYYPDAQPSHPYARQNDVIEYIPGVYTPNYQQQVPQRYYQDYTPRPQTTRDFERLLQILIYRYQRRQQIEEAQKRGGLLPYPVHQAPYNPYYNQHYPEPQLVHPDLENMYQSSSSALNMIPPSYELQRLAPRKKPFNPNYFRPQSEYYNTDNPSLPSRPAAFLPSDVREEILYRMLMLALQTNAPSDVVGFTAIPVNPQFKQELSPATKSHIHQKPVRSVQILGEER